jgi:GH43 family beta-xylosidase
MKKGYWFTLVSVTLIFILGVMIYMNMPKQSEIGYASYGGTFNNPITKEDTPDPSIVYQNGYYYFTFTHGGKDIEVWKSRSLDMRGAVKATVWTPPFNTMYSAHIWAPELQWIDGKWYIYFAASDSDMDTHRMYVLEGKTSDPLGEYEFKGQITDETDKWAIDGLVLEHGDKLYFVWSGWEGDVNIQQNTYIAPMSDPLTISGPRVKLSEPTFEWEKRGGPPYINEGEAILKHNDKVFLVYSASGSWTPDYTLGMLTLKPDGDPLNIDHWEKSEQPVFVRNDEAGVYGPGHNTFTKSPDGTEDWMIYHATSHELDGWSNRKARAQKVNWNEDGTPDFGEPLSLDTAVEVPSGHGIYEIEHVDRVQAAEVREDPSASLEEQLVFTGSTGTADYDNIYASTAGDYPLHLRYRNPSDQPLNLEIKTGSKSYALELRGTGEEWAFTNLDITLDKGQNTIQFMGEQNLELDQFWFPRYEAEEAALNKVHVIVEQDASNGNKVSYFNKPESSILFKNINGPSDGQYTLRIRALNLSTEQATHQIMVNGEETYTVTYVISDEWSVSEITLDLKRGKNEIKFIKGEQQVDLDYIEWYKN